jgi:two-component system sensor histidine kinase CpxA
VTIQIADRGPGVPEEALQRLFEPFYRPEAARGRTTGGSGLGLAISKRCIEVCGGTVTAQNREGGGLEVVIILPSPQS